MAGVLMASAIVKRAEYTTGQSPADPVLSFHLYVNDYDPTCEDTPGDYVECTLAGYAPVFLTPSQWSCLLSSCIETCTYAVITVNFNAGGQTIYGHYVQDDNDSDLMWAELWLTPFVVPAGGGSIQITLQWQDQQCPTSTGGAALVGAAK